MAAFDRTYEGLKHHLPEGQSVKGPHAFDRTYEGLKLSATQRPYYIPQTFDRTYEGLKPPWRISEMGSPSAF